MYGKYVHDMHRFSEPILPMTDHEGQFTVSPNQRFYNMLYVFSGDACCELNNLDSNCMMVAKLMLFCSGNVVPVLQDGADRLHQVAPYCYTSCSP